MYVYTGVSQRNETRGDNQMIALVYCVRQNEQICF